MRTGDEYRDAPAELTSPSLLGAMWRYRWAVLGITLGLALAGYGLTLLQTKEYRAESEVILADPTLVSDFRSGLSTLRDPARYVRNQIELMESSTVAARASELLEGRVGPETVLRSASARASTDRDLVTVQAVRPDPQEAADIANAVVAAYQDVVTREVQASAASVISELERSRTEIESRIAEIDTALQDDPDSAPLNAQREAAIAQLVDLETRIEQISVNSALYGSGAQFVEPADAPQSPTSPRPLRDAVLGGLLGLLLGAAFAWWRTSTMPVAADPLDPAAIIQAPLLGIVPVFDTSAVQHNGSKVLTAPRGSIAAEAYQFVLSGLGFALERIDGSTVVITSPGPGAGKTVTAANLGIAALADQRRPLLVDADERARGLTRLRPELLKAPGLTDLVQNPELDLSKCIEKVDLGNHVTIDLLPSGTEVEDTAGFFRRREFGQVMAKIRGHYDLTLVDTPPVLSVAETTDIVNDAEGVVIVVRQGTPLRVLEDTVERLSMTSSPILGYVFNFSTVHERRYKYGYGGYGQYGYGRHDR